MTAQPPTSNSTFVKQTSSAVFVVMVIVWVISVGCHRQIIEAEKTSPGPSIEQISMHPLHEETVAAITSVAPEVMVGTGLAGVQGGVRVKFLSKGNHEVLIPLVQVTETQIPVSYTIASDPASAVSDYSLRLRENSNAVVSIRLQGAKDEEVTVTWTSIVLIAGSTGPSKSLQPDGYLKATPCVQSESEEITNLADELWAAAGEPKVFAAGIQDFVMRMKQKAQPRTLDAQGILESGSNWICTANANLAVALMRARSIPARSLAVIPTTSQQLEMHRIVEYFVDGRWIQFDPSSLQKDIPMKAWQNIIMATTSVKDEELAMKPRMGVALGCPFGHELEFPEGGVMPWGKDFFWTVAKPLAEFETTDEITDLTTLQWAAFMESGKLSPGQIEASAARDAEALLNALKNK